MNNWTERTLGEICKIRGGKRLPAGSDFAEGWTEFPYIRVSDMVGGSVDSTNLMYVTPEIELKIRNYKISKKDIYVTIAGTLGFFGTIPQDLDNAQLTENAAKLTEIDFDCFEKDYLKYYLNSNFIQNQIKREIGIGGGVPKLALHRIERLKIRFPALKSQKKIAQILSTVDTVIEKTAQAVEKYKAIKQGMMHDLFTRGIDPETEKPRPRRSEAPQLYKETELGWVPKEWEVEIFGDIIELIHGYQFRDYDFTTNGVPVVKIGQVKPEGIDLSDCSFVSLHRLNEFQDIIIQEGDILMALTGATLGKACLTKNFGKIMLQNYRVGRFIPLNMETISKQFVYYSLTNPEFLNKMFSKINAGAQGNVGKADFIKLMIKLPSLQEQDKICHNLTSIDNLIDSEEQYLSKIKLLKQGLMHDLLSGKVDVKGLN